MKGNRFFTIVLLGAVMFSGTNFQVQASQSWADWAQSGVSSAYRGASSRFSSAYQSARAMAPDWVTTIVNKLSEHKKEALLVGLAAALGYTVYKSKTSSKQNYEDFVRQIGTIVAGKKRDDFTVDQILLSLMYGENSIDDVLRAYNEVQENYNKMPIITENDVRKNRLVVIGNFEDVATGSLTAGFESNVTVLYKEFNPSAGNEHPNDRPLQLQYETWIDRNAGVFCYKNSTGENLSEAITVVEGEVKSERFFTRPAWQAKYLSTKEVFAVPAHEDKGSRGQIGVIIRANDLNRFDIRELSTGQSLNPFETWKGKSSLRPEERKEETILKEGMEFFKSQ